MITVNLYYIGESSAGRQHCGGGGRRAAAQYQQNHQKVDGEISRGGRYVTCRRMCFIGAGRKCGHCTISCRGI